MSDETNEVEVKALEKGWKPEEEWDGDPEKWAPADEFLKMKDRQLEKADLAAQKEIQALKGDLAKYTGEIAELKDTLKAFGQHHSKVEERAFNRAMKEIEARMDAAVEDGDTTAYRAAKKDAQDLAKEAATKEEPRKPSADEIPAYKAWVAENDWYKTNIRMRNYANGISADVGQVTGLGPADPGFYQAITDAVKEEFPDKFETKRRPSQVEGVDGRTQKSNGQGWKDIPAEDRKLVEHWFKQGLYEDSPKGRAQYAKEYFAQ